MLGSRAWLHASGYDPTLDSVVLVHGYAGVTDTLPIGVLRDGNYLDIILKFKSAVFLIRCVSLLLW